MVAAGAGVGWGAGAGAAEVFTEAEAVTFLAALTGQAEAAGATELAAELGCLPLALAQAVDPTGTGQARWTMRWKPALNAFAITFSDRFPAAETY